MPLKSKNFKTELAIPDEWEECHKFRFKSLSEDDACMFTDNPEAMLQIESKTGEKEWRGEISSPNSFVVLSKKGTEVVGMGRAKKRDLGDHIWALRTDYVFKEHRKQGIAREIFAIRFKEILKRGGKKVCAFIRDDNPGSFRNAEFFGCQKLDKKRGKAKYNLEEGDVWSAWELDLTNPELINKINEVLNER